MVKGITASSSAELREGISSRCGAANKTHLGKTVTQELRCETTARHRSIQLENPVIALRNVRLREVAEGRGVPAGSDVADENPGCRIQAIFALNPIGFSRGGLPGKRKAAIEC